VRKLGLGVQLVRPTGNRPEIPRQFQEAGGFAALVTQIDIGGLTNLNS
jgi:hypothetical protein